MDLPSDQAPEPPDPAEPPERSRPPTRPDPLPRPAAPDLTALPIAGITRRRVAWVLAGIVSVWIVLVFARQVGDAGAASDRAARLRAENVGLAGQVVDLQRELALVQQQTFIEQEARAFGLGSRGERPFALAPGAPALPTDAPGSAAVRLGARHERTAPIEVWLDLLFGPAR